jgi:hypothetical protein
MMAKLHWGGADPPYTEADVGSLVVSDAKASPTVSAS